jgi:two-component system CheB/CheR fusion protein
VDYLEVHPEEFTKLFNTILINVTGFYRDEPAWDYLGREIIPRILAAKPSDEPIRVWSAACASGEEAYSLAILFVETLGPEAFQHRVKIYATDVDEEALAQARLGRYSENELQSLPAGQREKYFEPAGSHHAFRAELRRALIYGRHDLVQDAPISRLDLLVCRNTLMYFNAETQGKILARFHFALNDSGYLFLGKAEMLLTHANLFSPVEIGHRIFTRVSTVTQRDRLPVLAEAGNGGVGGHPGGQVRLREVAFEAGPVAQVVVDVKGHLTLVNARARALFKLSGKDLGRPLQDLDISYRPVELRSLLEQAYTERHFIKLVNVEHRDPDGHPLFLDVQVTPLYEADGSLQGASIAFSDVSQYQRLKADLLRTTQELEASNGELQSAQEELETTNEELQSTNEELETTNEELHSTNEELETTNEELHSTNEELGTLNAELHQRTNALNTTNAFLRSILASLRAGVVVVDRQLTVLVWNHRAEDLWGLRADEVQGMSLLGLDIGLPVNRLPIQAFLAGKAEYEEVALTATNRRGRVVECQVTCTPFLGVSGERAGVVLLMEEIPR